MFESKGKWGGGVGEQGVGGGGGGEGVKRAWGSRDWVGVSREGV